MDENEAKKEMHHNNVLFPFFFMLLKLYKDFGARTIAHTHEAHTYTHKPTPKWD